MNLVRARIAALRRPAAAAKLATALWIVWAVVVWNVVFDRVIVVAGRDYVAAAGRSAATASARPNMDAYMRPAVARGVWIASASAGAILASGIGLVHAAGKRDSKKGYDPFF